MRSLASAMGCISALAILVPFARTQSAAPPSSVPLDYSPTNPQAQRRYEEALKALGKGRAHEALDAFRTADRLDGGHCFLCELEAWDAAMQASEFNAAEEQALTMLTNAMPPAMRAQAEFMLGKAALALGIEADGENQFESADQAFQRALKLRPGYLDCIYQDGIALAHLGRDGDAAERFRSYAELAGPADMNYARVRRMIAEPALARLRLAPNFRIATLDGASITLESLAGKVVLIDFWATWCPPCTRVIPRLRNIAVEFEHRPFVLLSVSLDADEARWREYTAKNGMTWPQYRDGGFDGRLASLFAVRGIPYTVVVDADGVLEEQYLGKGDIEDKLRGLIARAIERQQGASTPAPAADAPH